MYVRADGAGGDPDCFRGDLRGYPAFVYGTSPEISDGGPCALFSIVGTSPGLSAGGFCPPFSLDVRGRCPWHRTSDRLQLDSLLARLGLGTYRCHSNCLLGRRVWRGVGAAGAPRGISYSGGRYPPAGLLILLTFKLAGGQQSQDCVLRQPQQARRFARSVEIRLSRHRGTLIGPRSLDC